MTPEREAELKKRFEKRADIFLVVTGTEWVENEPVSLGYDELDYMTGKYNVKITLIPKAK